VTESLNC